MNKAILRDRIEQYLAAEFGKNPQEASIYEIHSALGRAVLAGRMPEIEKNRKRQEDVKTVCYLSAEFLMGRAVFNNLFALGLLQEVEEILSEWGHKLSNLEEIEDAALGNGGLGRLAACFLDSAATHEIPMDGYGIRYRYGLFKQTIEDGFQREYADDWTKHGDPWSVRREEDAVKVEFAGQTVLAVPYDMPVFGYQSGFVGNLRLWQSEPVNGFDFQKFNDYKYDAALEEANRAGDISRVLYPNDSTEEGKILRLKQQYFFSSASMQDLVRKYTARYGRDFTYFASTYAIQINDTHPVIAIPELIRIMTVEYGLDFVSAFGICWEVFSYTNHTVMAEALETWEVSLFKKVVPDLYDIILMINELLIRDFSSKRVNIGRIREMKIVSNLNIHMAKMALYATHCTNGVAEIHTQILKDTLFKDWAELYPDRFQNKTNGITQRRWLALCNPELSRLISRLTGDEEWVKDLDLLKKCGAYKDDRHTLEEFIEIKQQKKAQLAEYMEKHEGVNLNIGFIFDIQIKRLHEYKRQLLNAFAIMDIYFGLKEGRITSFNPCVFIFGAKAAPGYVRAKGIIKYINEVAKLVNNDPDTRDLLQVVFIQNYNVSYAEKLIPGADISEQISAAGTEASGTGNMKLMLNGAVTLGTYDGANVEIVAEAGRENNYIFGATVEELEAIRDTYDPKEIYRNNDRISRVLDTLVDGTFTDGKTGVFAELYNSILHGASWHKPDNYFILHDFERYVEAKLESNRDYADRLAFAQKGFINMCNAGKFSSDRTVKQYAEEIWKV